MKHLNFCTICALGLSILTLLPFNAMADNLNYIFYMTNDSVCKDVYKQMTQQGLKPISYSDGGDISDMGFMHVVISYIDNTGKVGTADLSVDCNASSASDALAKKWVQKNVKLLKGYSLYIKDNKGKPYNFYSKTFSDSANNATQCPKTSPNLYENVNGIISSGGISWMHAKSDGLDLHGLEGKDPSFCLKK